MDVENFIMKFVTWNVISQYKADKCLEKQFQVQTLEYLNLIVTLI